MISTLQIYYNHCAVNSLLHLKNAILQSAEAYDFIKRDLTEFSNVVQHDTACSIVATASAVRSKLAVSSSFHIGDYDLN